MAELLDGRGTAKAVRIGLKREIRALTEQGHPVPGSVFIQIGENPASTTYVNTKHKLATRIGINSRIDRYPESISQAELLNRINELNHDPRVHAILVQLPLPDHISEDEIVTAIDPVKDVDCFHPVNVGRLAIGLDGPKPATPQGVMLMLGHYGIELKGKKAVVLGRSNLVGKPMGLMLLKEHATVTYCHSRTVDLAAELRQADVLIAAAGRAGIVTGEMVKPGAVVVDVGTNFIPATNEAGQPVLDENGEQKQQLVGDVDFNSVNQVAAYLSPVPGGVGPMTIASVLANAVALYRMIEGIPAAGSAGQSG